MNDKWLEKLKVGDDVFVSQRYGEIPEAGLVKRFTKTQIVVTYLNSEYERKFRRKDGMSVGGDIWHRQCLLEPTEERKEKGLLNSLLVKARSLKEYMVFPDTKEELIEVIDFLKKYQRKEIENDNS